MLDPKFVRENIELVKESLKNRNYDINLDEFLRAEEERRLLQQKADELKNKRNVVSEEIGKLRSQKKDASELIKEMKVVSDTIKEFDEKLKILEDSTINFLLNLPNIPHETVPVGKDETCNVEIRRWGDPGHFDFEPLNHWDIGEILGIIDFERASKIAGARFSIMKGLGAKLERALMNFMLDNNISNGYTEVFPPIIVNRESMQGTGQLPKFEAELFKIVDPEFYLIPTAEVPVTNIYRNEILNERDLHSLYTLFQA